MQESNLQINKTFKHTHIRKRILLPKDLTKNLSKLLGKVRLMGLRMIEISNLFAKDDGSPPSNLLSLNVG